MARSLALASFPEELLVRILSLSLAPPPRHTSDVFSPLSPRNRIAPLLVSRQFFRIVSPLLYHTLHFHSPHQAARILEALTCRPALADDVRRIVFSGVWHDCARVLALCDYVQDVDICLIGGPNHPAPGSPPDDPTDVDAQMFCDALEQRRTIRHLTLRKDPAVYLTHPRPVYVLQRLAQAVHRWSHLETVHLALRMSCSPSTIPLARALSVAPRLRAVRAQLPAVWNTLLLVVSTNPRLEKVMLYAEPIQGPIQGYQTKPNATVGSAAMVNKTGGYIGDDIEHAVWGTGLYMTEAKKHARFSELVKAGTWIIRTRAHTASGAVRAKEVALELMGHRDSFGPAVTQPFTASRRTHAQDM